MLNLEVGDIILEHTKFNPKEDKVSILSALIRFFTNNYWNHAKYVVDTKEGIKIQEALSKGIVERSIEDALYNRDILIMKPVIPLTIEEKKIYNKYAKRLKGVKYDFFGTLLFQLIKQIIGVWLGGRDTSLEKPKYCSEAPMTLHHHVRGIIKKPWGYSPANIRNENYFYPYWAGKIKS